MSTSVIGATAEATERYSQRGRPKKQHILFLDGIRGVAVLLILAYHHGYLNAGWAGVDLFFVLSGFLITGILLKSKESPSFWRAFWLKRVTRILPVLIVFLLLSLALGFRSSKLQILGYLFSFGDFLALQRPHFEVPKGLWSLAVEEHFYILWPFAIRFLPSRKLVGILVGIIAIEPVVRGVMSLYTHNWEVIYFLTPFRLDGLAMGSLLAILMTTSEGKAAITRFSGWATGIAVAVYVAVRLIAGVDFTREHPTWFYNSVSYSLVAVICLCFISYLITHPISVFSKALSVTWLVFMGQISYGVYLYQSLVREALLRHFAFTVQSVVFIDTPLVILLSWLSFKYFEQPVIAWGRTHAVASSDLTV